MSGFTASTPMLVIGAPISSQVLLSAVVGLLALVIAGLVTMVVVLRRRSRAPASVPTQPPMPVSATASPPAPPRARARPAVVRGGAGGLAVATSTSMVCPTCRTEYHGMTYCTRDARRLIPPEEMLSGAGIAPARPVSRSAGLVCMACRRAYEPGVRSCPHDGNELVPFPVYNATRPRRSKQATEPAGVIARICPVCATRYDLNARFCGHDAGQLVVIN